MTRRRKNRPRAARAPRPPAPRSVPSGTPARAGGHRATIGIVALVAIATGVLVVRYFTAPIALPTPTARPPAAQVAWTDFAGADACKDCHRAEYAAWSTSTHGRAGGAPSRDVVIARFNGVPMRFRDAMVTPSVENGEYRFTVMQANRPRVVFTVAGVIGGGHMLGGGTQGFVARFADGTIRFLPFDFIRREGVWFCNTIGRANRGWIPITPDLPLEACVDWPPQRILGTDARFSNCQECHGSQIEVRYQPRAKSYETRVKSLTVNCESCHGPGRRHVELAQTAAIDTARDIGMRSLATLSKDQSLSVCFQCHALKDVLRPEYLPGESLLAHYSLGLPTLGDRPWFADGRVRTFAYQQNHRFSDCYLDGSMTCVDCHDPHSQRYRDIWGRALNGRFDDGQCVDCHASLAAKVEAHTHHAAGSEGSRCVSCHMPYLQHPELGQTLRFSRSDHTIPIPRPAFDGAEGIESACRQCHADQSPAALQASADQWWGVMKPHRDLVAAAAATSRDTDGSAAATGDALEPAAAARQLLRPDLYDPMAQIAALNEFMERYLQPDMASPDPTVVQRLEELAASQDLDVQALALAALHYAAGGQRSIRRFLAKTLRGLGDREDLVRDRWRVALAYFGDTWRARGQTAAAVASYGKALEIRPNDAAVLGNMAYAYAAGGEYANAVQHYRQSLERDPNQPLTLVNLGIALENSGDPGGAASAYRQALAVNPREPLAMLNLGNVYVRQGQVAEAIEWYGQAIALNASLAPAHFNLARALAATGRLGEAEAQVRWGLEFEPDNADAKELLVQIQQAEHRR